ncbi:oligopeptide/dipeptide ABC transporter ATP-binding protein [Bradyrhizobium sp. BWA-3-5]|uniref:ABC transporter ATP-binding protein n=1 Tax=Bradyrhizobium sp. BWA-3-5 TaxID=3080013 RepID=UPI00293F59C6|nr:oligopeptide/dipeptide ABC transporter ATP-binding protein [Bradyrhizobium sp. BWA-3-5]WOH63712.1 ATP-binding cassette domain-containing protein [Bradyrhizobium sp. BWA-3-5]
MSDRKLLEVRELQKWFPISRNLFMRARDYVRAVDSVSFDVVRGEVLSIVGESGSGKTTLSRLAMRLVDPTAGSIRFDGHDITHLSRRDLRPFRRRMQMVFQDPYGSFNPKKTIEEIVADPLVIHHLTASRPDRQARVDEALTLVGLQPEFAKRYPHQFSGGQRQRIGIARALISRPELLIADEPVSALDVSVQAQVINLMLELKDRLKLTILFIAHDLAVVGHISDRVAVMYLGRMVEIGPTRKLFENPQHPYTRMLMSAVPIADPTLRPKRQLLKGESPSVVHPPSGCAFRTRCPYQIRQCAEIVPTLQEMAPRHFKACIRDDLFGAGSSLA